MMPTSLIKWLVASAMAMCALTENGKSVMGAPTKLIIDTDAGFDVDDVGELCPKSRTDSVAGFHCFSCACILAQMYVHHTIGVEYPLAAHAQTLTNK